MEKNVGQWVRFINNDNEHKILQIKEYADYIYINGLGIDEGKIIILNEKLIIAVASNPQELVKVGDLVDSNTLGYFVEVLGVNNDGSLLTNEYNDGQYVYVKNVIKILTPNADKSQYTLQWEAQDE